MHIIYSQWVYRENAKEQKPNANGLRKLPETRSLHPLHQVHFKSIDFGVQSTWVYRPK